MGQKRIAPGHRSVALCPVITPSKSACLERGKLPDRSCSLPPASNTSRAKGTWQVLAIIWHVLLWPKVLLTALIAVAMSGGAS
jgi:hypothetical protein